MLLKLAGVGVWDGGVTAQAIVFESTCWLTFPTEPMACLLGSDSNFFLEECLTTKQIVWDPYCL